MTILNIELRNLDCFRMSRQTKSYLMARFREMGIAPATRHGQNFLIDLNLHDVIIKAADLSDRDVVLEIGTGTGALTELMAQRAAAVVTVEIDAHLFELASETLVDYPHVTMLQTDALRNKNNFNPAVLDAIGVTGGAAERRG
jgi:16S rRNA (adenine1518-N6/adenine1519-N6)-dimethyltransferase